LLCDFNETQVINLVKRMTNKSNKQNGLDKRQRGLISRFRSAYERLSYNQRQTARGQFCGIHGVTEGTFRNKMNGFSALSETEVEWMESYDPYAQPLAA